MPLAKTEERDNEAVVGDLEERRGPVLAIVARPDDAEVLVAAAAGGAVLIWWRWVSLVVAGGVVALGLFLEPGGRRGALVGRTSSRVLSLCVAVSSPTQSASRRPQSDSCSAKHPFKGAPARPPRSLKQSTFVERAPSIK